MLFGRIVGSGPAWIVAFLGNPGVKYASTRHNMGFLTADALCGEKGLKIDRLKFKALTCLCTLGGVRVLLMKPQTYMNLSGEAVAAAASFYKIKPENVLVVADDTALAPGRLRIRAKGSAGGHNGLKSVIERLGSEEFPRIRIGVGLPIDPDYDIVNWVLGVPRNAEAQAAADAVKRAAQAVEVIVKDGPETAMNRFN